MNPPPAPPRSAPSTAPHLLIASKRSEACICVLAHEHASFYLCCRGPPEAPMTFVTAARSREPDGSVRFKACDLSHGTGCVANCVEGQACNRRNLSPAASELVGPP